jgi:hypothetical protein
LFEKEGVVGETLVSLLFKRMAGCFRLIGILFLNTIENIYSMIIERNWNT